MRDLLSRGIGVHHGGLLPLVKEVRRYLDPLKILTNRLPGSRDSLCSRVSQSPFCNRDVCHGET